MRASHSSGLPKALKFHTSVVFWALGTATTFLKKSRRAAPPGGLHSKQAAAFLDSQQQQQHLTETSIMMG